MSNKETSRMGRDTVGRAEELVRLRAELEVERLRFEVALAVVVSIHEEVPLPSDQTLVIEDLIARWQALSPARRACYETVDSPFESMIRYVWDTVEEISAEPFTGYTDETYPPDHVADKISLDHWRRYVARLRQAAGITSRAGLDGPVVPTRNASPTTPAETPEATRPQRQPLRHFRPTDAAGAEPNHAPTTTKNAAISRKNSTR